MYLSIPVLIRDHMLTESTHQSPFWSLVKCDPNHRVPHWFGSGGTVKLAEFQAPAMGSDTFHMTRLLQATSNLAYDELL